MRSLFARNRLDAELAQARSHIGREFIDHDVVRLVIAVWRDPERNHRPAPDGPICLLTVCLRWLDYNDMRCLQWRGNNRGFTHSDWQLRMPFPPSQPRELGIHMLKESHPIGQSPKPTPKEWHLERTQDYHEHLKEKHGQRRFNRARKLARQTSLSIQYWLEIATPEKFQSGQPVTRKY